MKLSKLVAFRNELERLTIVPAQINSNMQIDNVRHLISCDPVQFAEFADQVDQQAGAINQQFDQFEKMLNQFKQQINETIANDGHSLFQESYRLYDKDMRNETTEYILNRQQKLSTEAEELFNTRLQNYTDWRFPGLIVRPGLEKFVGTMVANDPLYLVDQHRDLLQPAVNSFAEAYQKRLRCYVVNERSTDPILEKLPDGQFGLCLVYNFFNFRPVELIRQWLAEIFVKLRPGGVLIMTINDCDKEAGVILAENYFACYTPGTMIQTLAETIGFEILYVWNGDGPISWIELRRPGELSTLRGGQTLAKIVDKGLANSK